MISGKQIIVTMKKLFVLLLFVSTLFSCGDEGVCIIKGRYASAPDGTVLYVTPVDDILSPIDSVVVRRGKFSLELFDTVPTVRFISSQLVIDGNFVVVEPGVADVDFTGEPFVGGTPGNVRLNRFMAEKEKILNLRKMCEPAFLNSLAIDSAMCDSIKEVAKFANQVFEVYALNEIRENLSTPVGCFYLFQSVGVVASERLLPVFEKIPLDCRNKLYDTMRSRVENEVRKAAMAERYLDDIWKSLEVTAVGKRYQNFELNNVKGGTLLLSNEVAANKYTLLLFWAGWKDGIKEQLAAVSKAYVKYRGKGLQVVGISLDGSVDECSVVVDELSLGWPQLCNPAGGSAEVAGAYGITEVPAAILVNKRGTIIARMATVEDILKKFDELF